MKYKNIILLLVGLIMIASFGATFVGITSDDGDGPFEYETIRGKRVIVYGYGVYKHMTADAALQGIGQDYFTLFLGLPLLGAGLIWAQQGSIRGRIFLAGVLGYFHLTYLFYTIMGMYNILFLIYVFLLGTTFFAFSLTMLGFNLNEMPKAFGPGTPIQVSGWFLILNSIVMGLFWLSVVLTPLLDGSIYPESIAHYTTLIVQGMDLGIMLPLGFLAGLLLLKRQASGYLLAPVYLVFLSLLMTALVAKIIAMALVGADIIPVVFIIPTIWFISIIVAFRMIIAASCCFQ